MTQVRIDIQKNGVDFLDTRDYHTDAFEYDLKVVYQGVW